MRAAVDGRPAPCDASLGAGHQEPQHRRRDDHQQGRGVDRPDRGDHQGAQCRVVPAGAGRGEAREPDDPAQAGPREEHRRGPRDVGEQVRRQLVDECRGQRRAEAEPEAAGEPQHAGAGGEEQRADPQPMGDPVRESDRLAQPVPRTLGPEVGDDLVRYPPGELAGVERPGGVADQAAGVEVQVQLGVGGHPSRGRGHGRHVGEGGRGRRPPQAWPSVATVPPSADPGQHAGDPLEHGQGARPVPCGGGAMTRPRPPVRWAQNQS